jgi:hypothetical protein
LRAVWAKDHRADQHGQRKSAEHVENEMLLHSANRHADKRHCREKRCAVPARRFPRGERGERCDREVKGREKINRRIDGIKDGDRPATKVPDVEHRGGFPQSRGCYGKCHETDKGNGNHYGVGKRSAAEQPGAPHQKQRSQSGWKHP